MFDMLGLSGQFALAAGAIAVVAFIAWRIRRSGYLAAREKQRRADEAAVQVSREVDDKVAGRTPEENRRRVWKRP